MARAGKGASEEGGWYPSPESGMLLFEMDFDIAVS
jgi:hypothetical protein